LNIGNDSFRPHENDEEVFGPYISCLSALGAFKYVTKCIRSDITFATNLLVRFSSSPIWRHWNELKLLFHHLRGTTHLGLFYSKRSKQ